MKSFFPTIWALLLVSKASIVVSGAYAPAAASISSTVLAHESSDGVLLRGDGFLLGCYRFGETFDACGEFLYNVECFCVDLVDGL